MYRGVFPERSMFICFQVLLEIQPIFLWKTLNFGDLAKWPKFWGERGWILCVSLRVEFWCWQWKRLKYWVLILLWSFGIYFVKELKLNKISLIFSFQGIAQRRPLNCPGYHPMGTRSLCMRKGRYTRRNLESTVSRSMSASAFHWNVFLIEKNLPRPA